VSTNVDEQQLLIGLTIRECWGDLQLLSEHATIIDSVYLQQSRDGVGLMGTNAPQEEVVATPSCIRQFEANMRSLAKAGSLPGHSDRTISTQNLACFCL
jgi:hypothetical protein